MIKNINLKNLIKFTLPVIFIMVFMSFYTMVDGMFVSNLIDENALSAINVVYPAISIILAFGLILGTEEIITDNIKTINSRGNNDNKCD